MIPENNPLKIAYVNGPYRAEDTAGIQKNIDNAAGIALCLWALGYAVICPHKNTAHFDGLMPDEVWLKGDLQLLELFTFPQVSGLVVTVQGWERSKGSQGEVLFCRDKGIELYHSQGVFRSLDELMHDRQYLEQSGKGF